MTFQETQNWITMYFLNPRFVAAFSYYGIILFTTGLIRSGSTCSAGKSYTPYFPLIMLRGHEPRKQYFGWYATGCQGSLILFKLLYY